MEENKSSLAELKSILEKINDPISLNTHPWVNGLIVQEVINGDMELTHIQPGEQLIAAKSALFSQMVP
jgi:hypothetical protein